MFTKENTFIKSRKDGITGEYVYDVMIVQSSGLKVCHSTFTSHEKALKFKEELINSSERG